MLRLLLLSVFAGGVTAIMGCSRQSDREVVSEGAIVEDDEQEMELPPGQSLATVNEVRPGSAVHDESGDGEVATAETPFDALPEAMTDPVGTAPAEDVVAAESTGPGPSTGIAASVVNEATAFYAALDGVRVTSELGSRIVDSRGLVVPNTSAPVQVREVLIQRPNRFAVRGETESLPIVASDGNQLTAYLSTESRYFQTAAPESLSALTGDSVLSQLVATAPTQLLPFHLLSGESGLLLVQAFSYAESVTPVLLDSVPCNRLTLTQEGGLDWNLWVASEGDPLLIQASVVQGTKTLRLPGRGETEITIHLVEKLYDWELNPELSDEEFAIALPSAAEPVQGVEEFLFPDSEETEAD